MNQEPRTLPPAVVDQDKALREAERSAAERLCELRWQWTANRKNPDRVTQQVYADATGVVFQAIYRDAKAWVIKQSPIGKNLNINDYRELAIMSDVRKEAFLSWSRIEDRSIVMMVRRKGWKAAANQVRAEVEAGAVAAEVIEAIKAEVAAAMEQHLADGKPATSFRAHKVAGEVARRRAGEPSEADIVKEQEQAQERAVAEAAERARLEAEREAERERERVLAEAAERAERERMVAVEAAKAEAQETARREAAEKAVRQAAVARDAARQAAEIAEAKAKKEAERRRQAELREAAEERKRAVAEAEAEARRVEREKARSAADRARQEADREKARAVVKARRDGRRGAFEDIEKARRASAGRKKADEPRAGFGLAVYELMSVGGMVRSVGEEFSKPWTLTAKDRDDLAKAWKMFSSDVDGLAMAVEILQDGGIAAGAEALLKESR